ncbi:hypothetical protein V8E52_006668 [Russula decolorans]
MGMIRGRPAGGQYVLSSRSSRCKPGDRNLGAAAMVAHKRVAARDQTRERKEEVVVFEPCMLTMVTEGGMGLRELAMPVDKVGAADSLTRAVTIMVIIIVERIKRSRREEVDGGQLERAVEKVTLSPLLVPSVAVGQNKGAKAEMPKGQVYSLDTVTKPCKT